MAVICRMFSTLSKRLPDVKIPGSTFFVTRDNLSVMSVLLSPHFSFDEMTLTSHRKWIAKNREVPATLLESGKALCATLLEPVRAHFGVPVFVHSGYRCRELNDEIGGATDSQHMKFEAADFHVPGVPFETVFDWIRKDSGLQFGQVILEGWEAGKPSWIHLSLGAPWRAASKSQQALTFVAGKYTRVLS